MPDSIHFKNYKAVLSLLGELTGYLLLDSPRRPPVITEITKSAKKCAIVIRPFEALRNFEAETTGAFVKDASFLIELMAAGEEGKTPLEVLDPHYIEVTNKLTSDETLQAHGGSANWIEHMDEDVGDPMLIEGDQYIIVKAVMFEFRYETSRDDVTKLPGQV